MGCVDAKVVSTVSCAIASAELGNEESNMTVVGGLEGKVHHQRVQMY